MNLREYQFSILSFVPSILRDERANLGVVVFDDATATMSCAFLPDCAPKIAALAPGFNITGMVGAVDGYRRRFEEGHPPISAEGNVRLSAQFGVLAGAMRNQLQLSEPKSWPSSSLDAAGRELYDLHVRPVGSPADA
jgi:hypothetical protein